MGISGYFQLELVEIAPKNPWGFPDIFSWSWLRYQNDHNVHKTLELLNDDHEERLPSGDWSIDGQEPLRDIDKDDDDSGLFGTFGEKKDLKLQTEIKTE